MLRPGALSVVLLLVASLCACNGEPAESRRGEDLWRAAVWEPDHHSFEPAITALGDELNDGTPDPAMLLLLGSAQLFAGHPRGGSAALRRAAAAAPQRAALQLIDGYRFSLQHRRSDALAAFDACLASVAERRGDEPLADEIEFLGHLFRGQERYFTGDYDGAIEDLERARELHAQSERRVHRELVRSLADAHVLNQQHARAEELMRGAVARDTDFPPHHFQLGMILAAQARTDEATAAYESAIAADPSYPLPRFKLAEIARRQGDLEAMNRQLEVLDRIAPDGGFGGEAHAARGAYWFAIGREREAAGDEAGARRAYDQSKRDLHRAIEANRLCARALTLLIQLATLTGEPQEVLDDYQRALDDIEPARPGTPAASAPERTFC